MIRSRILLCVCCVVCLIGRGSAADAPPSSAQPPAQPEQNPPPEQKLPPEQLDALVAPIALYPDPLLAQTLAAATYPLEIMQLQQWLAKNPNLKDKALADAVAKQPWDPSIQAMAALPEVVKRLSDDIQWTTNIGNAFLSQQSDVMDAVQRMRVKAKDNGQLKSTEQQKVDTKVVEQKSVIVVEQANPQVVYVPTYNPTVVYGPPVYPYPPIYYPPPAYGAVAVSFGVGVAMGAMFSGGWGWNCGWGSSNVQVNVHNNFSRNSVSRNGSWQHNSRYRGGTPYPNRSTAQRYGGQARGDSVANRQASGGSQGARNAGTPPASRASNSGVGAGTAGTRDMGSAGGAGGADRIGNQDLSRGGGSSSSKGDAFGGGGRGYDGSSTRAASSRGSSSMGSRRGGGGGRRR